jgi:selenide,water dikinase
MALTGRIRLTSFTAGGGCASKVGSRDLSRALRDLPSTLTENVLVGYDTSDDAGVFRLRDDLALVQTVDFFAPIVDDPYDYAMGGTPLTALNIVAFPMEALGPEVLARILAGGADVAKAAGVAILGGHTVEDDEPKYGMAVTGIVHPDAAITNAGARVGDVLVLTKPLGTGVLASALKKDAIDAAQIAPAVRWMTTLNAVASRAASAAGVRAATDVTGFGLLGHGNELARASHVALRIVASQVPVYQLARDVLARGISPGGTRRNAAEHASFTQFADGVPDDIRLLLSDAQTSGGLLIACPPDTLSRLLDGLREPDALAAVIGSVEAGEGIFVEA